MSAHKGWIGVDFDGTLAHYTGWVDVAHAGEPIAPMVARVQQWLQDGEEVRIFTARVHPLDMCVKPGHSWVAMRMALAANNAPPEHIQMMERAVLSVQTIQEWCALHIGLVLPVTNIKDYGMKVLYDDRCVQVRANTGELVE